MDALITSFGYLHDEAPSSQHLTLDLRQLLQDPLDTDLRELTGKDQDIIKHVLRSAKTDMLLMNTLPLIRSLCILTPETTRIAIGCGGGRHRSVVLADHIGLCLLMIGIYTNVVHRDIHHPVVKKESSHVQSE